MFGDLGHGLLMFLFAAFLVMREKPLAAKKSDNEVYIYIYIYIKGKQIKIKNSNFVFIVLGVEYILFWSLYYIINGYIFYVYWIYIQ